MSPLAHTLTYWSCGGEMLTLRGRPLSREDAEALRRLHLQDAERAAGESDAITAVA